MFTKLQLSIIVLLAILTMIYSFQQTEHFADTKSFKLKLTGADKYLSYKILSSTGYFGADATGTSFTLGSNDLLMYNNTCLVYDSSLEGLYTTGCNNKKGSILFTKGGINCLKNNDSGNVQLYLKTDYGFAKGANAQLKLERVNN